VYHSNNKSDMTLDTFRIMIWCLFSPYCSLLYDAFTHQPTEI